MNFDEEIDCFRRDMRKEAESISKKRDNLHWKVYFLTDVLFLNKFISYALS